MFYGGMLVDAALIPMTDLVTYIRNWYRVKIIDHGDGTWTAVSDRDGFIKFGLGNYFEIVGVNAVYLDEVTFQLSDTVDIGDVPQIKITDHGNGTWNALTSHDNLIVMTDIDTFEIRNANVVWLNSYTYQISDTID